MLRDEHCCTSSHLPGLVQEFRYKWIVALLQVLKRPFDYDAAFVEHCDPVRHGPKAAHIMSHDNRGNLALLLYFADQFKDLSGGDWVESGGGLVQEHYFGIECKRSRKPDPFLHPARNIRGHFPGCLF